jgi:hypothetical protein
MGRDRRIVYRPGGRRWRIGGPKREDVRGGRGDAVGVCHLYLPLLVC